MRLNAEKQRDDLTEGEPNVVTGRSDAEPKTKTKRKKGISSVFSNSSPTFVGSASPRKNGLDKRASKEGGLKTKPDAKSTGSKFLSKMPSRKDLISQEEPLPPCDPIASYVEEETVTLKLSTLLNKTTKSVDLSYGGGFFEDGAEDRHLELIELIRLQQIWISEILVDLKRKDETLYETRDSVAEIKKELSSVKEIIDFHEKCDSTLLSELREKLSETSADVTDIGSKLDQHRLTAIESEKQTTTRIRELETATSKKKDKTLESKRENAHAKQKTMKKLLETEDKENCIVTQSKILDATEEMCDRLGRIETVMAKVDQVSCWTLDKFRIICPHFLRLAEGIDTQTKILQMLVDMESDDDEETASNEDEKDDRMG